MLVRGSRHKCCKKGQCTYRYDFVVKSDLPQFREYDDPGGTLPVQISISSSDTLYIEGEGSFVTYVNTITNTNFTTIKVGTVITDLTSGEVGVVIRRPDTVGSISLWYLGNDEYELRQDLTVLEIINHVSVSKQIDLELVTPKDGTTDVNVYIGNTLIHTESAVTFNVPDILHMGVGINGDAELDWIEVSPCPVYCNMDSDCDAIGGVKVPAAWTLSIPTPTAGGSTGCPDYCESFGGDIRVLTSDKVSYLRQITSGPNTGDWAWDKLDNNNFDNPGLGLSDTFCSFTQIGDSKDGGQGYWIELDPGVYDRITNTMDPDTWPINTRVWCVDPALPTIPYIEASSWNFLGWVMGFELNPLNPTGEYRISLATWYRWFDGANQIWMEGVKYSSQWFVISDPTPLQDITQLDLDVTYNGSPLVTDCTFPANVLVAPWVDHDFGKTFCETSCTPPVTPQPGQCYIVDITMTDDNGDSWRWVVPTGASFNEETGSWEWTGTGISFSNYIHDTCGSLPQFDVKIHCVELEEGATKQWVMDITTDDGTSRLPFEWFNESEGIPGWEGTTNLMCTGETWDVYAIGPMLSSNPSYTFGSCEWDACSESDGLVFGGIINVSCYNNISDPPLVASGYLLFTQTDLLPVGVSPGSVNGMVYRALLPSNLSNGDANSVFLFVQSGSAMVYIVDSGLNLVADMFATIGYSCDPNDGKASLDDTSPIPYYWGSPNPQLTDPFGLCNAGDGNGDWDITFW